MVAAGNFWIAYWLALSTVDASGGFGPYYRHKGLSAMR